MSFIKLSKSISCIFLVWFAIKYLPPGILTIFIFAEASSKILMFFYFLLTSYKPNSKSKVLLGIVLIRTAVLAANAFELIIRNVCGFPFIFVFWIGAHVAILLLVFLSKCRKPAKRKAISRKTFHHKHSV